MYILLFIGAIYIVTLVSTLNNLELLLKKICTFEKLWTKNQETLKKKKQLSL